MLKINTINILPVMTPSVTEKEHSPTSEHAINQALQRTARTPDAKCLVVGYSPTGGGHTGRTLEIVRMALDNGKISRDSTVIFHVPPGWPEERHQHSGVGLPLKTLCHALINQDITVILSEADKPVYGYLTAEGGSDDVKILQRMANYPLRPLSSATLAGKAILFSTDTADNDYPYLPQISAVNLIASLTRQDGEGVIPKDKIYVLTDMAPDLQKAAARFGIAETHRLDQQNHAIMLGLEPSRSEAQSAFLAKVLGGTGEQISHIVPGEKNTLSAVANAMNSCGIGDTDTLSTARQKIYQIILHSSGLKTPAQIMQPSGFTGVITASQQYAPQDIKGMIYVYAHKKTAHIVRYIMDGIQTGRPELQNKLFVICGQHAIPGYNALHLAYIADADGITTAGAGTTGESIYLHACAGSTARLLILPIESHNEQQANADFIRTHAATKNFTTVAPGKEIATQLAAFIKLPPPEVATASRTMEKFAAAIGSQDTWATQAYRRLFADEPTAISGYSHDIRLQEQRMRENLFLKGTRKYAKFVVQLFACLDTESAGKNLKLTSYGPEISVKTAIETLTDDKKLAALLSLPVGNIKKLPCLNGIREALLSDSPRQRADRVKAFSESFLTGF